MNNDNNLRRLRQRDFAKPEDVDDFADDGFIAGVVSALILLVVFAGLILAVRFVVRVMWF